jgi:hypothetical protein
MDNSMISKELVKQLIAHQDQRTDFKIDEYFIITDNYNSLYFIYTKDPESEDYIFDSIYHTKEDISEEEQFNGLYNLKVIHSVETQVNEYYDKLLFKNIIKANEYNKVEKKIINNLLAEFHQKMETKEIKGFDEFYDQKIYDAINESIKLALSRLVKGEMLIFKSRTLTKIYNNEFMFNSELKLIKTRLIELRLADRWINGYMEE